MKEVYLAHFLEVQGQRAQSSGERLARSLTVVWSIIHQETRRGVLSVHLSMSSGFIYLFISLKQSVTMLFRLVLNLQ